MVGDASRRRRSRARRMANDVHLGRAMSLVAFLVVMLWLFSIAVIDAPTSESQWDVIHAPRKPTQTEREPYNRWGASMFWAGGPTEDSLLFHEITVAPRLEPE